MMRIIIIIEVLLQAAPDQQQNGKNNCHTYCCRVQQHGTTAQFEANEPKR